MKKQVRRLELCETSGPLKNLIDNLSGDNGQLWLSALKKMLRKENPFGPDFVKWMSVKTGISAATLYSQLKDAGARVAIELPFEVSIESVDLDLVKVSVSELGFPGWIDLDRIYARANSLGLSLCTREMAVLAASGSMKEEEHLFIGMEPFTMEKHGDKCISFISNFGIGIRECHPRSGGGHLFRAEDTFVFWKQDEN